MWRLNPCGWRAWLTFRFFLNIASVLRKLNLIKISAHYNGTNGATSQGDLDLTGSIALSSNLRVLDTFNPPEVHPHQISRYQVEDMRLWRHTFSVQECPGPNMPPVETLCPTSLESLITSSLRPTFSCLACSY